jgi:citrate/tricarballylate utilization protein
MATALAIFAVMLGAIVFAGDALTGVHRGEGAFYAVIPHGVMVALGGVTFGFGVGASLMGAWRYWRASGGGPVSLGAIRAALADAATTRHLGGGGAGCNDIDERYGLGRRHLHMATMWGFIACFAATCAGTLMHYGFGWISPYPWYSAPVLLGSGGGIALMIGTAGLFWIKMRTDRGPEAVHRWGMDVGFLGLLFWTAATGMALLLFRHTSAMGGLLALHLGFVLALFAMLPYSKMVHGLYRLMALVRHHAERERTGR